MRAFVMVEPKFFTPPEVFPTLLEDFAAWRKTNREHMEFFEFFAGGGGGFDRVFADKKDLVASDCERVADTPSEFERLGNSIPESFFEGLPPSF